MGVSKFTQPDHTSQEPATYKTALDDAAAVFKRLANAFSPHESAPPDMKVQLQAGFIPASGALPSEVAAQETATLTAPATNPRNDIVHIDAATGAVGVATGSEAASPSDPAIPAGKVAVARVRLTVGMTEIANADLDDLRNTLLGPDVRPQVVAATFSAVATTTTQIPDDDTIPQSSEGAEFMSVAITPRSADSRLVIVATGFFARSAAATIIMALFKNSDAGALAAVASPSPAGSGADNVPLPAKLVHEMAAGTTSAITFKIRAGPSASATVTFNGVSGARKYGAIPKSALVVVEYLP